MRTALLDRPDSPARRGQHPTTVALMVTGAVALAWSSEIHFHLWADGYRHIATIGPLFFMQGVVAALLALVVLGSRTIAAAMAGALFMVSTIGGLLLSDWVGLFGFHDHLDAPFAGMSLAVEGTGAALLIASATWSALRR